MMHLPACPPTLPPSAGYRIFQSNNTGDFKAWAQSNPFKNCSAATTNKMFAVETDATCVVRVFVLGDTA